MVCIKMSTDLPESSEVWRLPEDTSAVLQIFFRETYFSKWLLFVLLGLVLIFVIFTGEWNNVVSKMEAYGADRNLLLGQRAVNMIEALHRRKRALLVPPGHVVEHHNSPSLSLAIRLQTDHPARYILRSINFGLPINPSMKCVTIDPIFETTAEPMNIFPIR